MLYAQADGLQAEQEEPMKGAIMDRGDPFVVQNARSTIKGSSFDGQLCVASIADRRTVGIDEHR